MAEDDDEEEEWNATATEAAAAAAATAAAAAAAEEAGEEAVVAAAAEAETRPDLALDDDAATVDAGTAAAATEAAAAEEPPVDAALDVEAADLEAAVLAPPLATVTADRFCRMPPHSGGGSLECVVIVRCTRGRRQDVGDADTHELDLTMTTQDVLAELDPTVVGFRQSSSALSSIRVGCESLVGRRWAVGGGRV